MKKILILPLIALIGCAGSAGNVIPMEKGLYEVRYQSRYKAESLELALWEAGRTCKKLDKRHIVKEAKTEYTGLFNETANRSIQKASDVATVAGKGVFPLGSSDDYETRLVFFCE